MNSLMTDNGVRVCLAQVIAYRRESPTMIALMTAQGEYHWKAFDAAEASDQVKQTQKMMDSLDEHFS